MFKVEYRCLICKHVGWSKHKDIVGKWIREYGEPEARFQIGDVTMLIEYQSFNFRPATLSVIDTANAIIAEYAAKGFDLTLRQLYYQFVARDLIPNKEREYKKLGDVVSNGRLAGLISWTSITDRTRQMRGNAHWEDPASLIAEDVDAFGIDLWKNQDRYVEVWIEKDALVGILQSVCPTYDVNFFSCRGYTSQSAMWRAAQRFIVAEGEGKTATLIHLGDHDPSGIDMSRDIRDRLSMFGVDFLDFRRIALNMDQVEQYNPPPNPAKVTDARFESYRQEYGDESWELDALDPTVLSNLIADEIRSCRDPAAHAHAKNVERSMRKQLSAIADRFDEVVDFLGVPSVDFDDE